MPVHTELQCVIFELNQEILNVHCLMGAFFIVTLASNIYPELVQTHPRIYQWHMWVIFQALCHAYHSHNGINSVFCLEVSLEFMYDSKTFASMNCVFSYLLAMSEGVKHCGLIFALNKDSLCWVLWQTPNFMPLENWFGPNICIGDAKQGNPRRV